MTNEHKNAFNKLIGLPRGDVKNNRNVIINKFKEGDGIITVFTTAGNLNLEFDEIDGYLETITEPFNITQLAAFEKSAMPVPVASNALAGYTPSAENTELKNILMDTIRRVKDDPTAIPQAKAIFEGSHAVVAIQKQETGNGKTSKAKVMLRVLVIDHSHAVKYNLTLVQAYVLSYMGGRREEWMDIETLLSELTLLAHIHTVCFPDTLQKLVDAGFVLSRMNLSKNNKLYKFNEHRAV